jgi:undecaprenyl pyrophosphate phosphatase UppP
MGWLIIIGTLPIGVVGLLTRQLIEGELTKNLYLIGTSLIVWAILLWFAERIGRQRTELEQIGLREALVIGSAQVFALIPGNDDHRRPPGRPEQGVGRAVLLSPLDPGDCRQWHSRAA